ncbi:hypothetical protein FOMPIDRAFT_1024138 [Fomitopsis schrenkii]|uniref:Uncharacterized protein n=1 Tax=Fomitopsis schrenkii TaxID=2126942 RepID=S8E2Q6_FOMSC|nr:hypothetical protein FOMPIDRAFT_1024138 [Fomitopsis schrenkii]
MSGWFEGYHSSTAIDSLCPDSRALCAQVPPSRTMLPSSKSEAIPLLGRDHAPVPRAADGVRVASCAECVNPHPET